MHPGAIEGGPGGVFFLETEGADGTTIEHHVRHLSLRELQQLLTYGMSSFDADDPASEDSEDDSGVRRRDLRSSCPAGSAPWTRRWISGSR